jgi:hypothetical protein
MIEARVWHVSTPRWRLSAPPGFIRPCEPTLIDYTASDEV